LPETKKAIVTFQYAERIKSGLIIASKLVGQIEEMSDDERLGAEKMLIFFLNALSNEIGIAYNVSGMESFKEANINLEETIGNVRLRKYSEAMRQISKAISSTTTAGQEAAKALVEAGVL